MAYLMVHLNIAQGMYERYSNIKDKGAFFLGAIAPDAISFRQGYERSDKKVTHFCVDDEGDYRNRNYDEWKNSIIVSVERYMGAVNKDFLYGYFSHVITDIETTRLFHDPVREKHDNNLIEAYQKDCSAAEAILLGKMKNLNELWALLYQSNQHYLPGLFSCQDVSLMIDFMKNELYSNMLPDPEYRANIYSIYDFTQFIESTIETINIYTDNKYFFRTTD